MGKCSVNVGSRTVEEMALNCSLLFLLFGAVIHGVKACNEATFSEDLTACLKDLEKMAESKQGTVTAARVNEYCASRAQEEIACVEKLINSCRDGSDRVRRVLDKAIDVNAIRRSLNIVCNNSDIVGEKHDCIARYEDGVEQCMDVAEKAHDDRITALKPRIRTEGLEWYEDKTYESLCDFTVEVTDCQRPYGAKCGKKVGDLFDALALAVTPPVCSSVTETVNVMLMVTMTFVVVLKVL